jgi:hypothetical protein
MKKRYRLYIDESGDHTYHKITESSKRYLGLTGCLIEAVYYRTDLQPNLEKLKQKHFPHSPDDPLILHREDIINRRRSFGILKDPIKELAFSKALLDFFEKSEFTIISVVIDKLTHFTSYGKMAYHPYNYCMAVLLERYCGLLGFLNSEGDVMAESRGGREDKALMSAYHFVYQSGTRFRSYDFFQSVLTTKEIKMKDKKSNIAGLQVADMLAYPCRQDILIANNCIEEPSDKIFGRELMKVVDKKFNRRKNNGMVEGYGKIFLK